MQWLKFCLSFCKVKFLHFLVSCWLNLPNCSQIGGVVRALSDALVHYYHYVLSMKCVNIHSSRNWDYKNSVNNMDIDNYIDS